MRNLAEAVLAAEPRNGHKPVEGSVGRAEIEDAQATPANYPGGPATLFYFPRGDSFLPGDKQANFSTKFGPYEVRAHFVIKEMMYRGKLAV